MPIAVINNFDAGVKTYGDLLDSGKFENVENLETDKPGMAYRRDAQKIIANDTFDIKSPLVKWVHDELNNDAEWIMYGDNATNDFIKRYRDTFATPTTIKDFGVTPSPEETCRIIPFAREIRFANGQSRKAGLYQYIDRDNFWNSAINTTAAFDYDDAEVRNSELSYAVTVTDETGSGGELDLLANKYYYRFVAVFDNKQECPLPDRFYSTATSVADSTVILTVAIDFSSWNERITHIKVYRSDTAFGTYKLARTVNCTDTDSDTAVTYAADALVGAGLYDPSKSWTTDEVKDKELVIGGSSENIDSHSADALTLGGNLSADDKIWGGYYSIWDSGTIHDSTGFEDGTADGWLGEVVTIITAAPTPHSGTYCYKDVGGGAGNPAVCNKIIATGNGTFYVQVWVYLGGAQTITLNVTGGIGGASASTTTEGSWVKLSDTATVGAGNLTVTVITNDDTKTIHVDDIVISSAVLDSEGTTGYAGCDVVISEEFDYDTDSREHWRVLVGTAANGNNDNSAQAKVIINNYGKALRVESVFTGVYLGSSLKAYLSHNYFWRDSSTANIVNLYFYDQGDIANRHYLSGKTKITTNYKYGVYISGRMYGLYVRLDPDGSAEDFADLIVFSESDMPDVMPIGNAIRVQDLQGGVITGGVNMNGDLVVMAQKGVYVLRVPSVDPLGWELINPLDKIGNVAPDSLEMAEGVAFFAGSDNIYALTPGYDSYELANDILDQWQGTSNKQNSEFRYDPKKQRLICKFGDTTDTRWCLDVKQWLKTGDIAWTKMTSSSNYRFSWIAIDENLDAHSIYMNSGTFYANNLYGESGGAETFIPVLKTGILAVSNMRRSGIFRWLNLGYDSSDLLVAKTFLDRESTPSVSYTASTISFHEQGENLVLNPEFDDVGGGGADVFANWTEATPGTSILVKTAPGWDGTGSRVSLQTGGSDRASVSQSIAVKRNSKYVLAFYWNGLTANATCRYKVVGDQSGTNVVAQSDTTYMGAGWFQVIETFDTGENTSVTVWLYSGGSPSYWTACDFVQLSPSEDFIYDTADEFIDEGFSRGMKFIADGTTNNDEEVFDVKEVKEDRLSLEPADDVTNEAAGSSITLDKVVEFPANNSSGEKHVANRISEHATLVQVEIKPLANDTTTLELYAVELE